MDWQALGRETVDLLRRYLMLDTTNPPGNETVGARFLEEVLAREGIASETVESAPGRGNLVARLRGDGSEGGIVLHHHIDVVYADRRYWTVDPFGGVIQDDDDIRRVHGNDERVSIDNIVAGVRSYTEMLLAVAGA